MKRFSICLFLSFFLASSHLVGKPNFSFKRLEADRELPGGYVQDIFQDSQGYMWFATLSGLVRFDGHSIKVFRSTPNNHATISDNLVLDLLEDKQGFIWVSTYNGLNRYDPIKEEFTRFYHDNSNPNSISDNKPFRLLEDNNGNIWVGTLRGSINRFDSESGAFINYRIDKSDVRSLSSNQVSGIYEDKNGTIWVGTTKGLAQYDPQNDRFTKYQPENGDFNGISTLAIIEISEGPFSDLWVSTFNKGLFRLSEASSRLVHYPLENAEGEDKAVKDIPNNLLLDSSGEFWVTSTNGLHWFDKENDKFIRFGHEEQNNHSLSGNVMVSIYEDKTGEIWVGQDDGKVDLLNKWSRNISTHRNDKSVTNSISHNRITSLLETKNNELWIGTESGLNRFDDRSNGFVRYFHLDEDPISLIDNKINKLLEDRMGRVWIGSNYGLHRYDREIDGFVQYFPNPSPSNPYSTTNNFIRSLIEDSSGNIWMGTFRGAYRFDPVSEKFKNYTHDMEDANSLSSKNITLLFEDSNGIIWLGTDDQGLNRFEPENQSFVHYKHSKTDINSLPHNNIQSLFEDENRKLWIGTSNGLSLFDPASNKFEHFKEFTGKWIGTILSDEQNYIWIGTEKSISRFSPKSETFKHYDSSSLLQNEAFYSSFELSNGELAFGGNDGVIRFDPKQLQDSLQPPDIAFTDFLLFNQSVPIDNQALAFEESKSKRNSSKTRTSFVLDRAINKTKKLTLTHEESLFTFEFAALHYANQKKINTPINLKD